MFLLIFFLCHLQYTVKPIDEFIISEILLI